uniref:BRO1 domain-containing protein n=1 Tax=Romanomermis culicivorax TaxID=13658 RepID=A0A915INI9_ROMCU
MLSIPMKKSYEVDVAGPIRTFISCTYSTTEMPTDFESINDFNKLRSKACVQPLDRHESSLDVLYRFILRSTVCNRRETTNNADSNSYFFQMEGCIRPRRIVWWKINSVYSYLQNIFRRSFSLKFNLITSILALSFGSFEKACVMYNIAALQSQIAANQKMDTDDELKSAAKLFMQSAGFLNSLKDNVLSMVQVEASFSDMMPDTLAALYALMLAQAQEAIYLKAAKGKFLQYSIGICYRKNNGLFHLFEDEMKPALIAKVAAQAAELFAEAARQMGREMLRSLWDRDWLPIVNGKNLAFMALSHYHQSLVDKDSHATANELARLGHANACMQQAQQHFASVHLDILKHESPIITKAYESAKKDNDFIYHERVPDVKQLPAIQKAVLAKPQPPILGQHMSRNFKDLFEKLTPIAVQMSTARFETRKSGIVQAETARLREHTNLMNTGAVLPDSVRDKSTKIKSMGGYESLERLINDLPSLLKRNQEILDETKRMLDDEKSSDDQLRNQFKDRWTRMGSEKLTGPLFEELNKYLQILDKARYADGVVRQKFDSNKRGFELLSKTENRQIINIDPVFLKAMSDSGVIANDEDLSSEKLNELYGPLRSSVSESIHKQEKLMEQIQIANEKFMRVKGSGSGAERENILKMLVNAHDAFIELDSNLKEGTKFYNDLTPLLVRLQQKVSDYCFARKTEKEDLMKDLQMNIVNQATGAAPNQPSYHGGQTSNQPPSRPPPPKFQTGTGAASPPQPGVQTLQQNFGNMAPFTPYGSDLSYSNAPYPANPPQQFSSTTPYPTAPMPNYPFPQQPSYGTLPQPQGQQRWDPLRLSPIFPTLKIGSQD